MTARTGKKAIRTRPGLTNLEEQVIFYESYHSHPANIAIHLLCIWNIMWTMIYLATYYSPVQMDFPESVASTLHLPDQMKMNLGLAVTILYCVLHSIMEPFLGFISSILLVTSYYVASYLVFDTPTLWGYPALQMCWTIHIVSWLLQFVGHGVFEKRAPALLDSWDQAFLTAPLFVLLEIALFFGYRKEFGEKCAAAAKRNIAEFKAAKKIK